MRIVVDLPAPFGPSRPRQVPSGTSRSSPSTAVISPKRLTTPLSSIAGIHPRVRMRGAAVLDEVDSRAKGPPGTLDTCTTLRRAARLPFSSPGTTQEDQSRHAQDSPAQRHRRPVEPQRRRARLRRPDPARELPVRRQRLLAGGPAQAAAQGHLQAPAAHARAGRAARPLAGRRGRAGDEGVGARERRHPLHARVPAAHRASPPRSTTRSSGRPATAPRSPSSRARS